MMRIYFKFTNDNNPFDEAFIIPQTVLEGASKIGGAFIFIKILDFILAFFNKRDFESKLKDDYAALIQDS